MFQKEITAVADAAVKKRDLLEASKGKYILASVMAGVFVGFGMVLTSVIGGILPQKVYPITKLINGAAFSVALSLVVMAGAELFTGNNFVMSIGVLNKRVTWKECIKVWIFAYIGNYIGSLFFSFIVMKSNIINESVRIFIINAAENKMSMTITELFTRGILCNLLVCLAVWCCTKMKSEAGKLIMIFWCIFTFVTCGFEHSVANMTLLSLSLMIPHTAAVTVGGFIYNLLIVTLGNLVGGSICTGAVYWYISS